MTMRTFALAVAAVLAVGLLTKPALLQQKGGEEETGPYDVVESWPQWSFPRAGYIWGSQGGVFAESPNRIFLLNRGELKLPGKLPAEFTGAWGIVGPATDPTPEIRNCIVIVDGDGKLSEAWTQWDHLFQGGHGP